MGSEFEFPKTYTECPSARQSVSQSVTRQLQVRSEFAGKTYAHGSNKVRCPLVEAEQAGHKERHKVRHQSLDNEDDGYDGELEQLVGAKLGGKFGEDWRIRKLAGKREGHDGGGGEMVQPY